MGASVVSAAIQLYGTLPASAFGGGVTERPPIFLGEAAPTKAGPIPGIQQRVPYAILFDDGIELTADSSFGGTKGGTLRLQLFALKLDHPTGVTADSFARAVQYANRPPKDRAGFDFGRLPVEGCLYAISLKPLKEQRSYAGFTTKGPDDESARVHLCELTYRVVVGVKPDLPPSAPN
jgi:hypothetical protein